jgi:hypothetical protein
VIVVAFVMLAVALAVCIEGLVWVRATRRRLDIDQERLRALLRDIDGDAS